MVHEIALTIKPTMACNMYCKHCFNGKLLKSSKQVDLESVFRFIDIAASEFKDIKITFHGGEPTLAGYDFYKSVFAHETKISKKYGVVFTNLFTTNGLLLDEKLIDLLIKYNVLINISFDGPHNDILRQDTKYIISVIEKVQKKGARFRIFCTVSAPSLPYLKETYDWFKNKNWDFKILPIEPRGCAEKNYNLLMNIEAFLDKLEDLYRIWIIDNSCKIKFYTFQEFANLRRDIQFKPYWINREIALNPDGLIYPFGRPNDMHFCLGSPFDVEKISECFCNKNYKKLLFNMKEYAKEQCKKCDSFHICRSVCVYMSYVYGDNPESLQYECKMSNGIFNRILKVNDEIIENFRSGNMEIYNDFVKDSFKSFLAKE